MLPSVPRGARNKHAGTLRACLPRPAKHAASHAASTFPRRATRPCCVAKRAHAVAAIRNRRFTPCVLYKQDNLQWQAGVCTAHAVAAIRNRRFAPCNGPWARAAHGLWVLTGLRLKPCLSLHMTACGMSRNRCITEAAMGEGLGLVSSFKQTDVGEAPRKSRQKKVQVKMPPQCSRPFELCSHFVSAVCVCFL